MHDAAARTGVVSLPVDPVRDVLDVVRAARGGDREAFGALYRRYRPLVRGVLLARLTPADADDVVQEVFVVAFQKLSTLKSDDAIGGWLCMIARTRAIDHVRKRRDDASIDDVPEPGAQPAAHDVIEARRCLAAIRSLPEAYRETLVLRFVEGMSGPEIAVQTGLTEGSVRVNLSRGYALLQEALKR